jgi:hypothetical protein
MEEDGKEEYVSGSYHLICYESEQESCGKKELYKLLLVEIWNQMVDNRVANCCIKLSCAIITTTTFQIQIL